LTNKISETIPTFVFDNQHVIGLPKKWNLDPSKPLEFIVKLIDGKLVLTTGLENLVRTRRIDSNVMPTET